MPEIQWPLGSALERRQRLARTTQDFTQLHGPLPIGFVRPPAQSDGSYPAVMARPRNEGWVLSSPVLNIGKDIPSFGGDTWPDVLPKWTSRLAGFVVSSPVW